MQFGKVCDFKAVAEGAQAFLEDHDTWECHGGKQHARPVGDAQPVDTGIELTLPGDGFMPCEELPDHQCAGGHDGQEIAW